MTCIHLQLPSKLPIDITTDIRLQGSLTSGASFGGGGAGGVAPQGKRITLNYYRGPPKENE